MNDKKLESLILRLYDKHYDELREVNGHMKKYHPWFPPTNTGIQTVEMENEINWLLIRHSKPEIVVEMSPCSGWSSCWILDALHRNGSGRLLSYDLIDDSRHRVPIVCPYTINSEMYYFILGDCKERWKETLTIHKNQLMQDKKIDYVFIDSDHSDKFAKWYLEKIFPKVSDNCYFAVHDVIDPSTGEIKNTKGSGGYKNVGRASDGALLKTVDDGLEFARLLNYLRKNKIPYVNPNGYGKSPIGKKRKRKRVLQTIHNCPPIATSAIFFQKKIKHKH